MKRRHAILLRITVALAALFTFSAVFGAEKEKSTAEKEDEKIFVDFNKKWKLTGGGQVRLQYEYYGEPVNMPARYQVFATCRTGGPEQLIEKVAICSVDKHTYEKDVKVLTVAYTYSRVDAGGQVHCDQKDEKQYHINKFCKEAAKAK